MKEASGKGGNIMARKTKRKSPLATLDDTYGDMVTLLLCFFCFILFSSIDGEKWETACLCLSEQGATPMSPNR